MSETLNPEPAKPNRTSSSVVRLLMLALGFFVLFFLLVAGVGPGYFEITGALLAGWFKFLQRTLPRITWNRDLVGMGMLCVAIILFLAHRFLNWITRSVAAARGREWRWPWKWTWCSFAAVFLLFLVGMAIGGATHQIGWIVSSPEPLLERKGGWRFYDESYMRQLQLALRLVSQDTNNLAEMRRELWNPTNEYYSQPRNFPPVLQTYHLLIIKDETNGVIGSIVFPRDRQRRDRSGGRISLEDQKNILNDSVPAKELPELILRYQGKLEAL
jgi:hypothetical protein